MTIVESLSGVRGIYGLELTDEKIEIYAKLYSDFLKEKNPEEKIKIVVGRDARPSGESVLRSLIKGLDSEFEIIDVGILPTPFIQNAVREFHAQGGIIITASHNEPEFNGFKFLNKEGGQLMPPEIEAIIKKANERNSSSGNPKNNNNNKIMNMHPEAIEAYKKFARAILKTDRINTTAKILMDPNGGAGVFSKEIFESFGINAEYMNMIPGEFNRTVEPNIKTLGHLKEKIQQGGFEFLMGFDCDADRVEILLDDGSIVSGNHSIAIIADHLLSKAKEKEKSVVVNGATSHIVREIARKHGAKFKEVDVGEPNVVGEMSRSCSIIGGEGTSGGPIISPSKCRDGILTSLFLLKIISEKDKSLKDIIQELPPYHNVKEFFKIKEDFTSSRERIKLYYLKKGFEVQEFGDSNGGLKAIKNGSWIWFRQSRTEDLVMKCFADSKDKNTSQTLIDEAKQLLMG